MSNLGHVPTVASSSPHRLISAVLSKPSCPIRIAKFTGDLFSSGLGRWGEGDRVRFEPCLVRCVDAGGAASFVLGHPLLDDYLRFVSARSRPNTLRATAHDLKTFFAFVGKPPRRVTVIGEVGFISRQRLDDGDRKIVTMDGSSGVWARTIRRRLSSVSGLYAFLMARERGGGPIRCLGVWPPVGSGPSPPRCLADRHAEDAAQDSLAGDQACARLVQTSLAWGDPVFVGVARARLHVTLSPGGGGRGVLADDALLVELVDLLGRKAEQVLEDLAVVLAEEG